MCQVSANTNSYAVIGGWSHSDHHNIKFPEGKQRELDISFMVSLFYYQGLCSVLEVLTVKTHTLYWKRSVGEGILLLSYRPEQTPECLFIAGCVEALHTHKTVSLLWCHRVAEGWTQTQDTGWYAGDVMGRLQVCWESERGDEEIDGSRVGWARNQESERAHTHRRGSTEDRRKVGNTREKYWSSAVAVTISRWCYNCYN